MLIAFISVWLISAVLAYLFLRLEVSKEGVWTTEDRFMAIIISCTFGSILLIAICIWCMWPDRDTPARW